MAKRKHIHTEYKAKIVIEILEESRRSANNSKS